MTARLAAAAIASQLAVACTTGPLPENPPDPPPEPPVDETAAPVHPQPKPEPPPPPAPEADDLLGLSPGQVQDLLGAPSLVRREGAVQVMQFTNRLCVIDVVLYEPEPGAYFRADHIDARRRDGSGIGVTECLASRLEGGVWPPSFRQRLSAAGGRD